MTNPISYLTTKTGVAFRTAQHNLTANITAAKVAKVALSALAIHTLSNIPGADAGPITAWVTFAGCVVATITVPWFMVECPEIALIAAALPTP